MLQRIQSVWLLLALLGSIFLIYTSEDVVIYNSPYLFLGLCVVALLTEAIALFSFRNRKLQIRLANIGMLLNALLIGLTLYWLLKLSGGMNFPEKGIEPVFPVISWISLAIANVFIKKDERLVKSVDRLR